MKTKARVIAFYLPQFHPIPENDKWWGKGFTEWTNVGKAKPLFKGHDQPRVPADLGYYDLRLQIVREQQAELARESGVEAFCYWHYWFGNGKTLLSEVFDEVLHSGKPDFPFCLGWANHSWTRRNWNAVADMSKDMDLMVQEYPGDSDYINHFGNVLPAFKDHRYVKVDGKPIFVIYRPLDIPNVKHFMDLWNQLAKENGLLGIHFVGLICDYYPHEFNKFYNLGFDALTFENYANISLHMEGGVFMTKLFGRLRKYSFKLAPKQRFPYKKAIRYWLTDTDMKEDCYPSILPQWDPTPRRGRRSYILKGSTPELFKKHVEDAINHIKHKSPEHRILFLKSWNEWGEGNYMEPDLTWGHGYLNALREVIVEE